MFKLEKYSQVTTQPWYLERLKCSDIKLQKKKKVLTDSDFLWKRRNKEEESWDHYLT